MSNGRGEFDSLTEQLRDSLLFPDSNKPDFRELNVGSPVSPLMNTRTSVTVTHTTTSSSSSSGGSMSGIGRAPNAVPHLSKSAGNSGELCTSLVASTRGPGVSHSRSEPLIHSGERLTGSASVRSSWCSGGSQSSVSSPVLTNVLPAGNICPSGRVVKTGMASRSCKTDVLGSGTGNYGHGNIMRGGNSVGVGTSNPSGGCAMDAEDLKRMGNNLHKKGLFEEALGFYDKAIGLCPSNASYRSNRAAALIGLGRVGEAVKECEEAVQMDPNYWRAHHRLGSLYIRLGQTENAKKYLSFPGQQPDSTELRKLENVEKHVTRCADARKSNNWKNMLRECEAAIAAGADFSPPLIMCKAEASLKVHNLEGAEACLRSVAKLESSSCSRNRIFGMLSEAYTLMIRAQIDMALGKFDNAVSSAEKAVQIDTQSVEISQLLNNVRAVGRARARGNELFTSDRFTEACAAYGEGLRIDPSNSVLYCNRAACWSKLGLWEKSVEDCNHALRFHSNYTKALLRRAASNSNLERWREAVQDYDVLRRELPDDAEIADAWVHAHAACKNARGEPLHSITIEEITITERFKEAISSPGVSVVHFMSATNKQCKQLFPYVDLLSSRYPSISFLQVDVGRAPEVASAESLRIVPTFKIYKNGLRVKEIVCPTSDMLELSVRHYS